jgi:predicted nuclease of predicted toxin-antitoxin system
VKLLFDENLSFPGSSQARLVGLERANDHAIWDHAKAHEFVVVMLDADFAEIAGLFGPPPKVIWLRCGNQPTYHR